VDTPVSAIVLVRNVWDRNWRTYDDPVIGYGLLASGIALTGLLTAAGIAARPRSLRSGRPPLDPR
jgi:hypothetical protein